MPRPTQSRNGPIYIGGGWYRTPSGATVNAGGPPPRPVAPGGIR
ncbi:hypothetical protein [Methylobacterium terrae]|nr:hypothetical protein [Methylobacterium terrae]